MLDKIKQNLRFLNRITFWLKIHILSKKYYFDKTNYCNFNQKLDKMKKIIFGQNFFLHILKKKTGRKLLKNWHFPDKVSKIRHKFGLTNLLQTLFRNLPEVTFIIYVNFNYKEKNKKSITMCLKDGSTHLHIIKTHSHIIQIHLHIIQ